MENLGEKLMELRIATRSACNCEQGKGCFVTLREKVLFLVSRKPQSPPELMERLCMVKSNLALLCNKMVEDGAIVKVKNSEDKRVISYHITEKGERELQETLKLLENKFKGVFSDEKEYAAGVEKFDALLDLLSFL